MIPTSLIIVADRGSIKAYKVAETPARGASLHLIQALELPAAHGRYDETYGEFALPYAEVQASNDPRRMLGEFLQSAYESGADIAKWDRAALEREPVAP